MSYASGGSSVLTTCGIWRAHVYRYNVFCKSFILPTPLPPERGSAAAVPPSHMLLTTTSSGLPSAAPSIGGKALAGVRGSVDVADSSSASLHSAASLLPWLRGPRRGPAGSVLASVVSTDLASAHGSISESTTTGMGPAEKLAAAGAGGGAAGSGLLAQSMSELRALHPAARSYILKVALSRLSAAACGLMYSSIVVLDLLAGAPLTSRLVSVATGVGVVAVNLYQVRVHGGARARRKQQGMQRPGCARSACATVPRTPSAVGSPHVSQCSAHSTMLPIARDPGLCLQVWVMLRHSAQYLQRADAYNRWTWLISVFCIIGPHCEPWVSFNGAICTPPSKHTIAVRHVSGCAWRANHRFPLSLILVAPLASAELQVALQDPEAMASGSMFTSLHAFVQDETSGVYFLQQSFLFVFTVLQTVSAATHALCACPVTMACLRGLHADAVHAPGVPDTNVGAAARHRHLRDHLLRVVGGARGQPPISHLQPPTVWCAPRMRRRLCLSLMPLRSCTFASALPFLNKKP